jgi:surface protein
MRQVSLPELRDMILEGEDISIVNYSHITDMSNMFWNCKELKELPKNFNTSKVVHMRNMFQGCKNLETLPDSFDTSSVRIMNAMFWNCHSLKSIPHLDTSNTFNFESIDAMFYNCINLEHLENPSDFYRYKFKKEETPKLFKNYPELFIYV